MLDIEDSDKPGLRRAAEPLLISEGVAHIKLAWPTGDSF
jgi:hypothetical protein